jgi:hypothetical protein
MSKRLIYCRISMGKPDNRDEDNEIAKLRGRTRANDYWGKATLDLEEVFALSEYYPALDDEETDLENLDGELEPAPECNVHFKNGLTWGVQIPYEEMKALLREYRGETEEEEKKKIDLGLAISVLTDALDNDEDLYRTYKDCIAMTFKDEYGRRAGAAVMRMTNDLLHEVSNAAADNFLKMFIKSVE